MSAVVEELAAIERGLVFANLVEFDSSFGHRNDPAGYAGALEAFDRRLPEIEAALAPDDVLIVTADHGNDPTTASTDHSRERVPVLATGGGVVAGTELGERHTFADCAATVAALLGTGPPPAGTSFAELLRA